MRYFFLMVLIAGFASPLAAQKIKVDELVSMLEWSQRKVDTTLKKRDYLLMQKDVDSTSSLFQYSNTQRLDDGPTLIRSLVLMDAAVGGISGRMITYRTYDKNEYREFSAYLIANNYHKTNDFDFDKEKHYLYSNGNRQVRLKLISTQLKNKAKSVVIAYEIEIGK
jgi:hypothetical protein